MQGTLVGVFYASPSVRASLTRHNQIKFHLCCNQKTFTYESRTMATQLDTTIVSGLLKASESPMTSTNLAKPSSKKRKRDVDDATAVSGLSKACESFLPRPPSPLPISTTKPTKPQGKKEKIEDILSLIPPHETVIFDPLPVPNRRTAQLCLPSNIDILDPYAVFSR